MRGRITRLGDVTVDSILKRHDYPRWAAHALGEALALAILTAATLKIDGRILVQAEGNGPVRLLVAEARTDGGVRGYLRLDRARWDKLAEAYGEDRPPVCDMIGKGVLGLMVIQENSTAQPYQGIVPLDGETIADCAQHYFNQSEQIPTRVRLSVLEIEEPGGTKRWRAGGAVIQQIASDDARGDTQEHWDYARAMFESVTDDELVDPNLSSGRLLFRLYHEEGVRMEKPQALQDACTCSKERLVRTLSSMPVSEVRELANDDGILDADCQFCGRIYHIPAGELTG